MIVVQYACKQLSDILLGVVKTPQHLRKEFLESRRNGTSLMSGF